MSGFDLIFELGTEEIPAGYFASTLSQMEKGLNKALSEARLSFKEIKVWSSPRRLALAVWGLDPKQSDVLETISGPPLTAAFDANGSPTKAAEGFAKSQGVAVTDLVTLKTAKGNYLGINKKIEGRTSEEILIEILTNLFTNLSFPKTMTWGLGKYNFVRPVHWLLAVFGGKILPISFAGMMAGQVSYGHRFISPGPVVITSPDEYESRLRSSNVIINQKERLDNIKEEINNLLEEQVDLFLVEDDDLLNEISHLVEDPVAVLGGFDSHFLEMPLAVGSTAMKEHQRYFTLVDKQGRLAPYFMAISNTRATDLDVIKVGHERVLRARLDDAKFYFDEDKKVKLKDRKKELSGVIFHHNLGSYWEKVERFKDLAAYLGNLFNFSQIDILLKAAELCKCDLVSGVVKEFPSLQGVMGQAYALIDGESEEVGLAIYEHYLPNRSGGKLPLSEAGSYLSIADKMDTICGCFAVGLIPTGAADPFALRRQSLGIINILLNRKLSISFSDFIERALNNLSDKLKSPYKEVKADVLDFFKIRLKNQLISQNISADGAEAVLCIYNDNPLLAVARIEALEELKKQDDFKDLAQTFKRVVNIIKKFGAKDYNQETESFLNHQAEKNLLKEIIELEKRGQSYLKALDFKSLLTDIASLKVPVDIFFEEVLVDDLDPKIKNARIALLSKAASIFELVADFSKISTAI